MYLWFLCIFILYKNILLNKEKESENDDSFIHSTFIYLFIYLTLARVISHITLASLLTTNHTVCHLQLEKH